MNMNVYTRITDRIIARLEKGESPLIKPRNAEHAAGKITRPLRHNGVPYAGFNVLALWLRAAEFLRDLQPTGYTPAPAISPAPDRGDYEHLAL